MLREAGWPTASVLSCGTALLGEKPRQTPRVAHRGHDYSSPSLSVHVSLSLSRDPHGWNSSDLCLLLSPRQRASPHSISLPSDKVQNHRGASVTAPPRDISCGPLVFPIPSPLKSTNGSYARPALCHPANGGGHHMESQPVASAPASPGAARGRGLALGPLGLLRAQKTHLCSVFTIKQWCGWRSESTGRVGGGERKRD